LTTPRLHYPEGLAEGASVRLEGPRAHYLAHVLRLRPGARLWLFNDEDGEWAATLAALGRQSATLELGRQVRAAAAETGPVLHFVPFRRNRLDWLVEKAVELGVARLVPILTERTVVKLENPARLRAIAVEAAEQCGRLTVPELADPVPFGNWLAARDSSRKLLFADEGGGAPIATALAEAGQPDLLTGPEGGFTERERTLLLRADGITGVTLGSRILRAETAALAALAVWQAICGFAAESP
jgi:16S rRNA (uracil1498-N3)-methyltransferase